LTNKFILIIGSWVLTSWWWAVASIFSISCWWCPIKIVEILDKYFFLSSFLKTHFGRKRYIKFVWWCTRASTRSNSFACELRLTWIFGSWINLLLGFLLVYMFLSLAYDILSRLLGCLFIRVAQTICRKLAKNFGLWNFSLKLFLCLCGDLNCLLCDFGLHIDLHWYGIDLFLMFVVWDRVVLSYECVWYVVNICGLFS